MAQRISIVLEDDLDGTEASETIAFALEGTTYEIDLNEGHASELRDALAKYIGAARRAGRPASNGRSRRSSGATAGGPSAADVRAWAEANGHQVPQRGRIPASVREAYDAAH